MPSATKWSPSRSHGYDHAALPAGTPRRLLAAAFTDDRTVAHQLVTAADPGRLIAVGPLEIAAHVPRWHRGRAVLVGEKTFGTGTVLKPFPLSDGSALMLAIEEWLTPNGRVIWHQGIAPDVVVSLKPPATPLLPDTERTITAAQLQASDDRQLLHAVDLVTQATKVPPP